jgi:hypothetical protein
VLVEKGGPRCGSRRFRTTPGPGNRRPLNKPRIRAVLAVAAALSPAKPVRVPLLSSGTNLIDETVSSVWINQGYAEASRNYCCGS